MAKGLRFSQAVIFTLVLSTLICNAAAVFSTRNKEVRGSPPPREEKTKVKQTTDETVSPAYSIVYYYNC